jgi:hypothetical protein
MTMIIGIIEASPLSGGGDQGVEVTVVVFVTPAREAAMVTVVWEVTLV